MNIDASVISYVVKYGDIGIAQKAGVSQDYFVDEHKTVWRYLTRVKRDHDTIPSPETLQARFPDLELPGVRKSEWPHLLATLRKRKKYLDFVKAINAAADSTTDFEQIDEAVQSLQGSLNTLAYQSGSDSHIVDLFSAEIRKQMMSEIQARRSGAITGIPTGLKKFDNMTGGLHKQQMVTVIGRSGIGKSWIDLLFMAQAVIGGYTCLLYPLEMNLFETATRLYTIFTSSMWGADQALKNYDLTSGRARARDVRRFLTALEDRFAGHLLVADTGLLSDQYTLERIEAEAESYKPDMFWVDYITLLKTPPGAKDEAGWNDVMRLSHGIKQIAMRRNLVGGCSAQVNREAVRNKVFLPRLEHIAYGDSIGQDSDLVFSINRKTNSRGEIFYALVKHRGGREIGKTRIKFLVNEGIIIEESDGEDDEEATADAEG